MSSHQCKQQQEMLVPTTKKKRPAAKKVPAAGGGGGGGESPPQQKQRRPGWSQSRNTRCQSIGRAKKDFGTAFSYLKHTGRSTLNIYIYIYILLRCQNIHIIGKSIFSRDFFGLLIND
jgi:hypothetical protein